MEMRPAGVRAWSVPAGAALTLSGLLLIAGGAQPARAASTLDVSMRSFAFSPATVTVHAGDTVTWTYDEKPTDVGCENPVFHLGSAASCPAHSTTAPPTAPHRNPLCPSR